MRGGTLLHKVHLAPASRYSEDIDLVVIGDRPEDHNGKKKDLSVNAIIFNYILVPPCPGLLSGTFSPIPPDDTIV